MKIMNGHLDNGMAYDIDLERRMKALLGWTGRSYGLY
jgi:hypothetical protein